MLKYKIRKPDSKEILKCINVLYNAFGRDPPSNIKEEEKVWKALIKSKIGKFLISEENGQICGIGGVFIFDTVSSFGYMAVLPKSRGKGIGTAIFRDLLEIAKESNCETMILYASKMGKPIYEKFGFQDRFYGTMYQLPTQLLNMGTQLKQIKVLGNIPEWVFDLDEKAIGFNRRKYLNLKVDLGSKLLVLENEGYGLLVGERLGPLIANNQGVALMIIKKGISLGANHLIIASHKYFPKTILESINLKKKEEGASLKMIMGKKLTENLELLYAIGTFAKG